MTGVVIGIDPGLKTGIAIFVKGGLEELRTISPWEIPALISRQQEDRGIKRVIYEDSRLQSHIFSAHKPGSRALGQAQKLKIARNVGQIDGWCCLIAQVCAERGITCHGISPAAKGAKLDAKRFEGVTGWQGRSNEHERDAAMVAWRYRRAV